MKKFVCLLFCLLFFGVIVFAQNKSTPVPIELQGTWNDDDFYIIISETQLQIITGNSIVISTINSVSSLNNSSNVTGFPFVWNISHTVKVAKGSFSQLKIGDNGIFTLYLNKAKNKLLFEDGEIYDKL